MKVWVDLSNSPHPLLFAPIARRLEQDGHEVLVTARDNAQTVELARQRWPAVEVIGGASPPGRRAKAAAILGRVEALRRWGRRHRPDIALSHNSYAQVVAARAGGIRTVTAMDFEHQPVNHLAFRLAHTVLLPKALAGENMRRQGATGDKTRYYDGLKEEVYLGDFEPDPRVLGSAGIERNGAAIAVVRTPPSRALYHRFANPIFLDVLRELGSRPDVHCIALARHPEQRSDIEQLDLPGCVVPSGAVDARSAMYFADLVIGAGGTMTREAALLGVPTFSVFAGAQPAVDRWLEQRGRLRRLVRADDLPAVERRAADPSDLDHLRERSSRLVQWFVHRVMSHGTGRRGIS